MILNIDIFKTLVVNIFFEDTNDGNYRKLENSINTYERGFYYMILGHKCGSEYVKSLTSSSPAQKWLDLKNGSSYDVYGVTYDFVGLDTLCAYYVYFKHTFAQSEHSPNGEIQTTERVDNTRLRIRVWNDLVDMVCQEGKCYIRSNPGMGTLEAFIKYSANEYKCEVNCLSYKSADIV